MQYEVTVSRVSEGCDITSWGGRLDEEDLDRVLISPWVEGEALPGRRDPQTMQVGEDEGRYLGASP